MKALWHPGAAALLARALGPYDPTEPYHVEHVVGDTVTVVERHGRRCEAEWAVDWLQGTRTQRERDEEAYYRLGTGNPPAPSPAPGGSAW